MAPSTTKRKTVSKAPTSSKDKKKATEKAKKTTAKTNTKTNTKKEESKSSSTKRRTPPPQSAAAVAKQIKQAEAAAAKEKKLRLAEVTKLKKELDRKEKAQERHLKEAKTERDKWQTETNRLRKENEAAKANEQDLTNATAFWISRADQIQTQKKQLEDEKWTEQYESQRLRARVSTLEVEARESAESLRNESRLREAQSSLRYTAELSLQTTKTLLEHKEKEIKEHTAKNLVVLATEFARGKGFFHSCLFPTSRLLDTQSFKRFEQGLKACGYSNLSELLALPENYLLGFHGTPHSNLSNIFENGFDTSKRGANGQVHGAGEYFDICCGETAKAYTNGSGSSVIVALIIRANKDASKAALYFRSTKQPSTQMHSKLSIAKDNSIAVVNNDTRGGWNLTSGASRAPVSYCLPILVASTEAVPHTVNSQMTGWTRFQPISRIQVLGDGNQWINYDAESVQKVEKLRHDYPGSEKVFVGTVNGRSHFDYYVDFTRRVQQNSSTLVERQLWIA